MRSGIAGTVLPGKVKQMLPRIRKFLRNSPVIHVDRSSDSAQPGFEAQLQILANLQRRKSLPGNIGIDFVKIAILAMKIDAGADSGLFCPFAAPASPVQYMCIPAEYGSCLRW